MWKPSEFLFIFFTVLFSLKEEKNFNRQKSSMEIRDWKGSDMSLFLNTMVWFLCLIAYQSLRVILCQSHVCRGTVVLLFNHSWDEGINGFIVPN